MVQPILSFSKVLTKRQCRSTRIALKKRLFKIQYCSTHIVFFKSFVQKTKYFFPYCAFWKFWPIDNMVQPILSLKKIFTKRQYGSTHIVFFESFDRNTIWFNTYSSLRKFWQKHNMFNPYCLFRKFWPKDKMVQPI